MSRRIFEFTIPGRLPGMNEIVDMNHLFRSRGGKRFYAYHDAKAEFEHKIAISIASAERSSNLGVATPCRLDICWLEETAKRDPDNISAGVKFILDALVKEGILQGDSRKYISSIHHTFDTCRWNPRVEVRLTQ